MLLDELDHPWRRRIAIPDHLTPLLTRSVKDSLVDVFHGLSLQILTACYHQQMGALILVAVYIAFLALLAVAPEAMIQIMLTLAWLLMLGAVLFSVVRYIVY